MQHPSRSVPVGMQPVYWADLNRLLKKGVITEVHEHTGWVNSTVPVVKFDNSLRLCLDLQNTDKVYLLMVDLYSQFLVLRRLNN